MKKSSYIFSDNGDLGFHVELIYEDTQGGDIHSAILESFDIPKERFAEMSRLKTTKSL